MFISFILSFGMAVALVEKGKEWPIRRYNLIIRWWLHNHIHYKAQRVLICPTCASFWLVFVSDIAVCIMSWIVEGHFCYFFWPFSGFMVVGFTYVIFEFLKAIDVIKIITLKNE
jgi:hypothetical protein